MSDDNVLLKKVLEINENVTRILANLETIKLDNSFLKKRVINNSKSISRLNKVTNEHEKKLERLDTDITSIKSSINKFDKLDNKIFRFKQFIALVTYNNKYARVGLTALTWFILIAIALIILYNLIFLFNIDKKVVEDIVDIIK